MAQYEAGTCNIGGKERAQRRYLGVASLVVAFVTLAIGVAMALPPVFSLVSAVFIFGGAMGLLQSRQQFCAAYGWSARYGFDGQNGDVTDDDARSKDRMKALKITLRAAGYTLVGTFFVYGMLATI